jgi:hypothetical protein
MGGKQAKQTSTELTPKRSFLNVFIVIDLHPYFVLDIALLKANTKFSEKGRHIWHF